MLSSRMSLTRCPRARTPRLPARGASVLRESLCPLPLCVIFSRPSTPPRRSPVRRPPPSRSAPAIRRDRRTASCNSQLQLATFPRSADYTGLKSNLSPFRINTSKNLCTFRISLISGHLKRDYILDTKAVTCYAFFMRGFLDSAATFLMCLTTLGWNKCFISSSLLMSRGCFFFFMVTR